MRRPTPVKACRRSDKSAEWQKYMKDKSLQGEFMTGKALKDYWKRERANHEVSLRKSGAIK